MNEGRSFGCNLICPSVSVRWDGFLAICSGFASQEKVHLVYGLALSLFPLCFASTVDCNAGISSAFFKEALCDHLLQVDNSRCDYQRLLSLELHNFRSKLDHLTCLKQHNVWATRPGRLSWDSKGGRAGLQTSLRIRYWLLRHFFLHLHLLLQKPLLDFAQQKDRVCCERAYHLLFLADPLS